ncbi:nickel ABC transporter permease [Microbacterium sp.]|uniref:nickel ABC transporter permease n=1 Tax=Microbacterium sp. TaxID=51671 RepID=UPI0027343862|nr:nickel ABC transporter permease [Microbacterium sp.]MDP3949681.1 ABC transporter permease [Microbacterium sp.]
MPNLYIRQVLQSAFVLLNVTIVVFVLIRIVPGDPVRLMLGMEASEDAIQAARAQFGYDRPLHEQYLRFVGGALRGDLGHSLRFRRPVGELLMETLPATLELAAAAVGIALVLAFPAGIYAAVHRGSLADRVLMGGALIGQAMPIFWLGIMLITLFSVKLGWLPTSGRGSLAQLVMPSVTLSTYVMALLARLTRSNMLEVLREPYVRTARAKGLREALVVHKHALKSAALPIVTVLGLQIGALLSGAVVTETVFNWPGIGTLALRAIQQRDYPVLQGVVLVSAVLFVVINGIVDLLYRFLDPRVRLA